MLRRTLLALTGLVTLLAVCAPAQAAEKYPVPYTFTTSAVLAGAQVDGNAPGSNRWSCRPSRRHPRPVVLVHGTGGNRNTNWQTYAPLLANHGYCVFALTYGVAPGTPPGMDQVGGMTRMERSARQLRSFVARVLRVTGARKVDLVGHSQGTLMPDYWLKFLGGAGKVHDYISLAPLWHGTGGSDAMASLARASGYDEAATPVCGACLQMETGSEFLRRLRAGGLAVPGVHYTNIVTKYDELVTPYTSGIQRGMRNVVVQDRCARDYSDHLELAADPVAAAIVLNALDPKHPRPVPCRLVLPVNGSLR
ncbi:MAG TPA: alpha/beta fold hydrolase [Marmoricola sp.]|nr:alpha/beta fold hydrolase [Marmoricola sp.]